MRIEQPTKPASSRPRLRGASKRASIRSTSPKPPADIAATADRHLHLPVHPRSVYRHFALFRPRLGRDNVDDDTETSLDCRLAVSSAVVTRRRCAQNVAAGTSHRHTPPSQPGVFYFDFLEAAVVTDVPDALTPRTGISPALDFDTDHTYKLSPARLMWIMDKLGYAGPMNEYLGVFWWNQRTLFGRLALHRAGRFHRYVRRRTTPSS